MNMKMNSRKAAAAALAVILSATLYAGTSAANESTELKRTGVDGDAKGTVVLEFSGSSDCDRLMRVNTSGLEPDSLYSIWIVKKNGEKAPAGLEGKNYFTTDSAGMGSYSWFTWVRNVYWKTLEITHHPDGKAGTADTESTRAVLSARITP